MSAAAVQGRHDGDSEFIDLLTEDGDALIPILVNVLRCEIFLRCDADGDGALGESDLQHLARWCNGPGGEFSADELGQIHDTFACDKSGRLTAEGLEDMYTLQTSADDEATVGDLKRLGYRCSLTSSPSPSSAGGTVEISLNVVECHASETIIRPSSAARLPPGKAESSARSRALPSASGSQSELARAPATELEAATIPASHEASSSKLYVELPRCGGEDDHDAVLGVWPVPSVDTFFELCDLEVPFAGQRVPVVHTENIKEKGARFKLDYAVVRRGSGGQWILHCNSPCHADSLGCETQAAQTATATQTTVDDFLRSFSSERDRAMELANARELPDEFESADAAVESLMSSLTSMRQTLVSTPGLPARDVAASQRDCDQLASAIAGAKERWQPRKKFSFKSRRPQQAPTLNPTPKQPAATSTASEGASALHKSESSPAPIEDAAETLTGHSNQTFNFCKVSSPPRRFVDLQDCTIIAPAMAGSIYVENCLRCKFYLASQQLRIHDTSNCDFFLFVKSGPIIEGCTDVRFGPYLVRYESRNDHLRKVGFKVEHAEGGPSNACTDVNDFKWLRTQQSPHWSTIDHAEPLEIDES